MATIFLLVLVALGISWSLAQRHPEFMRRKAMIAYFAALASTAVATGVAIVVADNHYNWTGDEALNAIWFIPVGLFLALVAIWLTSRYLRNHDNQKAPSG